MRYHQSFNHRPQKVLNIKPNKNLILTLIQADLKHNQLIGGLGKLDLRSDAYFLGLHKAVAQLMGLGTQAPDQWLDIYDRFLEDAHKQPLSDSPDSLIPIAQECYDLLCASIKIEDLLNPEEVD